MKASHRIVYEINLDEVFMPEKWRCFPNGKKISVTKTSALHDA